MLSKEKLSKYKNQYLFEYKTANLACFALPVIVAVATSNYIAAAAGFVGSWFVGGIAGIYAFSKTNAHPVKTKAAMLSGIIASNALAYGLAYSPDKDLKVQQNIQSEFNVNVQADSRTSLEFIHKGIEVKKTYKSLTV